MVFNAGWSPGDLLKLVELAIQTYKFWKNAPGDAQGLREKLKYLASQLNFPEDLLEQVGHKEYPHAKELKRDLQRHNEYFQRFAALTGESEAANSRLIETVKFGWKADSIARIKENVEEHLNKLRDFRQDMILKLMAPKFRRFQKQKRSEKAMGKMPATETEPPSRASTLVTNSNEWHDLESILSRAAIAYEIGENVKARYSTSVQTQTPVHSPEPVAKKFSSEDVLRFKERIVELTIWSKSKLYIGDVSPTEDYKDIRMIAKALDDLYQLATTSPNSMGSGQSTSTHPSPLSRASSVRDQAISPGNRPYSSATPPSSLVPVDMSSFNLDEGGPPTAPARCDHIDHGVRDTSEFTEPLLRGRSRRGEFTMLPPPREGSPSSPSSDDSVSEVHSHSSNSDPMARSAETVMAIGRSVALEHIIIYMSSPLAGNKPVPRRLTLSQSEGVTWLSTTAETRALTPDMLLFSPQRQATNPPDGDFPAVYKHSLGPGLDSYPYIKHPSIDMVTPMHKDAPYCIHFVKPQCQFVSHHPNKEHKLSGIKYHLRSLTDRKVLRENIVGKTLLADVGVDEIWVKDKTACCKESLSLWQENPSETSDYSRVVSITFPYYAKGNPSAPDRILGYAICNRKNLIEDLRKAKEKHRDVKLDVEPVLHADADDTNSPVARQGSVSTVATTSTTGSIRSIFSRRSSGAATSATTDATYVYIKFSETQEAYRENKKRFLNNLIRHFSPSA